MPAGYGVRDHRLFVLYLLTSSLIGQTPPQMIRSGAIRLNTKIPSTKYNYTNVLENLVVSHCLTERMVDAHNAISSIVLVKEIIEIIDQECVQYMHHAERKCCRIKYGRIPFSPDSSIWVRRCQVYCSILGYHDGKIRNRSNLKWSARRCGIGGPLQLSLEDVRDLLQVAHEKCKYFRKHGHFYKRKHLNNRLRISQQRKDEE